ncbi:hypothetical protein [Paraburkholderia humisilvae]|uniref:Lipoprotein n=1 Tax=Paraburkholderia humisilvae TaxID=627669 RepID=A0A6J5EY11_9BURK|nr:hypothetical protein [Paraburkholderia humisilvae]CAB3771499.1 hypothetical protein LMG29542_06619 [Paraburkholderia humisilvae]
MKEITLTVLLSLICSIASACGEFANNVTSMVQNNIRSSLTQKFSAINISFDTLHSQCKVWKQRLDKSIIVVPYQYEIPSDRAGSQYFGFTVVVIDEARKAIVGKSDERKLFVVNSVTPDLVEIDTANYKIRESILAFGVRLTRRNGSSASSFRMESMNLYILEQNKLKKIIDGILMSSYFVEGDGQCNVDGVNSESTIAIGKSVSNGYSDLLINRKTRYFESSRDKTNCNAVNRKSGSEKYMLEFDGIAYRIPDVLRAPLD